MNTKYAAILKQAKIVAIRNKAIKAAKALELKKQAAQAKQAKLAKQAMYRRVIEALKAPVEVK